MPLLSLPIEAIKHSFIHALENNQTLILSAPPGAGKSTRLPLWLLDISQLAGQKIYLLQPRRIAAKNIACFLADQLGEVVGHTIGYRLRNDSMVSKHTQLEVITEGILTQIIQNDPELTHCGLIIFDEFHERSLHADLAFALTRDIQQGLREDLKIVLMSATLASDTLLHKLPGAIALRSDGRSFPVSVSYQAPSNSKLWREHALRVIKQVAQEHKGSILVFLPAVADIHFLVQRLSHELPSNMLLSPLYGELSIKQQQQAIAQAKDGEFKLVLATNIAETSLTIEGVNLVIDCGLEKVALYDQQTLTNRLHQQGISKASAIQRMGRAGRLMPGKCIRLYSIEDFDRRREHNITEIHQADILPLLIESARWGVTQLSELPLLDLPNVSKELIAWQELKQLNIVDVNHRLTKHGHQVSLMASHPRFAHMIIKAKELEQDYQVEELALLACIIAALLETRDIFRGENARFDCDLRHRIMNLFPVLSELNNTIQSGFLPASIQIKQQIQQLAKQSQCTFNLQHIEKVPLKHVGTLLALAYPERIAKYRNRVGEFLTRYGKGIRIHFEDVLANEPYVVAANIQQFNHEIQVRLAAPVDINILIDWRIIFLTKELQLGYNIKSDRIIAKNQNRLDNIVIDEQSSSGQLTASQIAAMWCEQVQTQGLKFLPLQEADKSLISRWRWLNEHQSHLSLPDISDELLINQLDVWFSPFVGKIKTKIQLNKLNFSEMLLTLLDYRQQKILSTMAPTQFVGPTGRSCPIRYGLEYSPTLSLPMQELYGMKKTPFVGDERTNKTVPLILELLSPAQRPIQVTQDLVAFWQGSYQAVQKDMKSQYPRHYWPDDPANAKATNKVKRLIKGLV